MSPRSPRPLLLSGLALILSSVFLTGATEFDRYDVILDKAVFGRPVVRPAPGPRAMPTPPPQRSWAEDYRMTMITLEEETGEIRVGLQHVQTQAGYLLIQNDEPVAGLKLIRAVSNNDEQYADIALNQDVKRFTLSAGVAVASPPVAENPGSGRPRVITRSNPPVRPAYTVTRPTPTPVPPPKYTGEELEQHLQNYQMDVIRQGLPPLPVPLTPEMDAQLVQEGVLPPEN